MNLSGLLWTPNQVIHRRQGTRREGSREAWIWWPAPLETWAACASRGAMTWPTDCLTRGDGWWMALWELGPAGATAAAGDTGLGAASNA